MRQRTFRLGIALVASAAALGRAVAENIDPANNGSQHAWGENVGWINLEPSGNGGPGVQVSDFGLTGWMWGENIGWVSLSCQNTTSCATVNYGIAHDSFGVFSGLAWGENVGWINFAPNTGGVQINPATGDFSGYAWGENIGWVSFNCGNTGSCSTVAFKARTDWVCSAAFPSGTQSLRVARLGADAIITWEPIPTATRFDIVRGSLATLASTGGDFSAATQTCLSQHQPGLTFTDTQSPLSGQGFWYIVRGVNCGGGTYESAGPGQVGVRDPEINGSPGACAP